MSASALLAELDRRSVGVRVEGGSLVCGGNRSALTPDLVGRLKEHKAEILTLLAPRPAYPPKVNGIYVHRGDCPCEWCHC